jgi:hypothetical protein
MILSKLRLWLKIKFGKPTKEDYITHSLSTKEGRRILGNAMVEPIRSAIWWEKLDLTG